MNMGKELLRKIIILLISVCSIDGTLVIDEAVQQFPDLMKDNIMTKSKLPPSIKDLSPLKNIESLLRQTGNAHANGTSGTEVTTQQGPCHCSKGLCGCCSRFLFDTWRQKACVNVTYDPDEFSFTAKIWMNDKVLYTRTVSGKNPRPVCIPVPRIPTVRACVRFYNIYFQGRNVHACISMEGKFRDTIIFKVGLDCIRLGANGVALVRPEDGGGLGQIELLPDDASDDVATELEDDYDDEDSDDDNDDDDDDADYF